MENSLSAKGESLFAMPPHNGLWAGLMGRCYDFSHSCCEFTWAVGLLCLASNVLLQILTTSSSYSLSTSLFIMTPEPWGKRCNTDIWFGASVSHSLHINQLILRTLASWECLYKVPSSAKKYFFKISLMRLRNACIYGYKDKNLGGNLMLCPLSRT